MQLKNKHLYISLHRLIWVLLCMHTWMIMWVVYLVFAGIMYYYITLSSRVSRRVLFYMFHFWNKYNHENKTQILQNRQFPSLKFFNIQFMGHKQVGRSRLIWWAEFAHPLSVRRLGYCNTKQLVHFISTACGGMRQVWWRCDFLIEDNWCSKVILIQLQLQSSHFIIVLWKTPYIVLSGFKISITSLSEMYC